jgi:broad specificity phosphatase PhoE
MITLFYSPHMTSIDNVAGRASGHADVPLSEKGRREAQELGRHYVTKSLDTVFCSDLLRAVTTAQLAFAPLGIPIILDARLRECDYGAMTQCPPAQLGESQHITQPYPQGESWHMAVQRVGAFLHEIYPQYDGQRIAVIGHKATKYGIDYWCGTVSLAEIMGQPWEWRDIPIWRYEVDAAMLFRAPR